ncbi:Copia protein [Trachymyrmex cornetzi]|uniref:Copia protein n=1 Tax=Trachymyrmex cornetzi TaxID=471704 RepID=A0A151JBI6_9HYME|nr:Copia protein [Trachymyrmex cornetzi]
MANSKNILEHIERLSVPINITVAKNDVTLNGECVGKIKGYIQSDRKRLPCSINNVLFVKDLKCNLLSIRQLEDAGFGITFKNSMVVLVRNGTKVATAVRTGKLYELEVLVEKGAFVDAIESKKSDMEIWHRRMGRLNNLDMEKFVRCEMVVGLPKLSASSGNVCEPCIFGEQTRKPFPKVNESRSTQRLELIHSDVCGPINPVACNGARYFVSFIDNYTHFSVLYVIKQKSKVFEKFKEYVALSTAKFKTKISVLIADIGIYYGAIQSLLCKERNSTKLHCSVFTGTKWCCGTLQSYNHWTMIFSVGLKKCFGMKPSRCKLSGESESNKYTER